jgi:hypothetical protein
VTITRLLTEANIPEIASNRAQKEFILSIRGLDNSWAATQLQDLIKKEQMDEDFPPIADLIVEFRSYYRRTRPIGSGLGTFATLGVAGSNRDQEAPEAPEAQPRKLQTAQRNSSGARTLRCLDGENHKFESCPYVNQSVRTKGWKPDEAIQAKFTQLRDSPMTNSMANALRAVERALSKNMKPRVEIQMTSVINMDDEQPARDRPHVNAVPQMAAATGVSAPPLLTRWILNPGSNCHVTNTRGADWISTKRGGPSDWVYAGGVLAQVEEWGGTSIRVKTPTGEG